MEAESGSGNRGAASSGQASGGQYVGGFGNSGEYMNYTITGIPSAGNYTLRIWYASGENPQFGLVVNGNLQTTSASSNGNWNGPFSEKTVTIYLQAGNNSLRMQGTGNGAFSLDRLCVNGGGGSTGCTPPGLSLGAPACTGTSTYSVPFSAQAGASVSSNAGSVQGNQVVNIPAGTNATVTASLNGCSSQQTANSPACNSGGNPVGCGTGTGLTGFYTNSPDLSDYLVVIRNDAQINFTWNNASPGTVIDDGFSVRWFGQVEAPVTGMYTFKTNNDDGTRLWVNGQTIIDDWNGHAPTWQQGSIYLAAGQKYDIVMDYYDGWGGAQALLYWEYPGQSLQLIPSCRLYPQLTAITLSSQTNASAGETTCSYDLDCVRYFVKCNGGTVVDFEYVKSCGSPGGGSPVSPPPGPTGLTGPTNPGGGYPGTPGGPASPTPPKSRGPSSYFSKEELARRQFFTDMANKRIYFTGDEVAVLNEFPALRANVRAYVNEHGNKPDGSNAFKLSNIDLLLYPKFGQLVTLNIRDYVMNNPKILNALKKFSGLNERQISGFLQIGTGPQIVIKQITDPRVYPWGQPGYVYGNHDPDVPDIINIDMLTINYYEHENNWPEMEKALFTLLTQTLIHELSHYGAAITQTIDFTDGPASAGGNNYVSVFDIAAYGYPNNAGNVLLKIVLKKP